MATGLDKPVVREIRDWVKHGTFGMGGSGSGRNLLISLEPGNIISFREKGLRSRYDIDIESVFQMAVRRTVARETSEKRKAKKIAKLGG